MFASPHLSRVMCHMSRVTCHESHVMCHMSHVSFLFNTFFCKLVELVCGGSVISGPPRQVWRVLPSNGTVSSFLLYTSTFRYRKKCRLMTFSMLYLSAFYQSLSLLSKLFVIRKKVIWIKDDLGDLDYSTTQFWKGIELHQFPFFTMRIKLQTVTT